MDFDEARKNVVGERLTRRCAWALQEGQINETDFAEISEFILDTIDTITTQDQLLRFLTDLSQKWPIFSEALALEQGEEKEQKEGEKIGEVENLLKEHKLDEALAVAENATGQEAQTPIQGAPNNGNTNA